MRGEAEHAPAWEATASHEQRKAQIDAVAKAQKFDVTHNYYDHLKRYPYGPPQNHVYDEGERLRFQEDFDFFEGTPEARQAIIDDLDAQIAPWPSYELTPEDYGFAAAPNTWKVQEPAPEGMNKIEGAPVPEEATEDGARNWNGIFEAGSVDTVSEQPATGHANTTNNPSLDDMFAGMAAQYDAERSLDSALSAGDGINLSQAEQAVAAEIMDLLAIAPEDGGSDSNDEPTRFNQFASLNANEPTSDASPALSEAERAQAHGLARRLSIRLQGNPDDPAKVHPEYEKVAFFLPLLWGGMIAADQVVAGLIAIYGAAKVYELTGGPSRTVEAVKDLAGTARSDRPGKAPMPIPPGMTGEQSRKYYQGLSEDLIDLWTKPLESRGNATTQHGNKIVAKECHDVLKTEFPELLGKIDHIGGADFRGEGRRLKEWTLLNPETGMKNRSRADLT